jgi:hypothetical protein
MTTETKNRRSAPVRNAIETAVLTWLAKQDGQSTRATNKLLASKLDLPLHGERGQNRRLNEALASLREKGLVEIQYEPPHPRTSPAGRAIVITSAGILAVSKEDADA